MNSTPTRRAHPVSREFLPHIKERWNVAVNIAAGGVSAMWVKERLQRAFSSRPKSPRGLGLMSSHPMTRATTMQIRLGKACQRWQANLV